MALCIHWNCAFTGIYKEHVANLNFPRSVFHPKHIHISKSEVKLKTTYINMNNTTSAEHQSVASRSAILKELFREYEILVENLLSRLDDNEQEHRELGVRYHKVSQSVRDQELPDPESADFLRYAFIPRHRTSNQTAAAAYHCPHHVSEVLELVNEARGLIILTGTEEEVVKRCSRVNEIISEAKKKIEAFQARLDVMENHINTLEDADAEPWSQDPEGYKRPEWTTFEEWVAELPDMRRAIAAGKDVIVCALELFYAKGPEGLRPE